MSMIKVGDRVRMKDLSHYRHLKDYVFVVMEVHKPYAYGESPVALVKVTQGGDALHYDKYYFYVCDLELIYHKKGGFAKWIQTS